MFTDYEMTQEMDGLFKFAMRLTKNSADAEDLLQSTILRAYEKRHLFNEGSSVFKWCSKIMYNLFVSGYRRKVKFETQYDPEAYLERESVEASQDDQMLLKQIGDAMKKLSGEHSEILVMICVQGMQYQEAAEALNIPVGTVRSRLSRARSQLEALMDSPMNDNMQGKDGLRDTHYMVA